MGTRLKTPVAVVGVSGYSGLELCRLLMIHPQAELVAGFNSQGSFRLSDFLPEKKASQVPVYALDQSHCSSSSLERSCLELAEPGSVIFLATPAEVSKLWAPKLVERGADVIDLSGAFRLSASLAEKWYAVGSEYGNWLEQAEYGLVPWVGPSQKSASGRLVANPGCYATCVLMALIPLLKANLIDPETVVIDAKSGATGAGKKATQNLLFSEVEGECLPYRVGKHQHHPEICQYLEKYTGYLIDPFFTTHLLNTRRGMIAGIYAKTNGPTDLETISACFKKAYEGYELVHFGPIEGESGNLLSLKRVVGSARVEIRFSLKGKQLYVFSLIDNLMKGAASQAIENFNRLTDLPLSTALAEREGVL